MGIDRSYLSPAEPWRDESRDEMLRMTLRVEGKPDYTLVLPADEEYLDAVKAYLDIDAFADAMLCDIRFIPAVIAIFIFNYIPIYGLQLAFKDLFPGRPISEATWVGLSHYKRFFSSLWFEPVIRNTVVISLFTRIMEWPFPIVLALLMHNCVHPKLKKVTQTVTFLPYLISIVVTVSIMQLMLSPSTGIVNILLEA